MTHFKKTFFLFLALTIQTFSFSRSTIVATYDNKATQKLWQAVVKDDLLLAQKAIDEKANPQGTQEENFLILATQLNHLSIIKLLVFHKVDINVQHKVSGETPLIIACKQGNPETVNYLLWAGADRTKIDCDYNSALSWAKDLMTLHEGTEKQRLYQHCALLVDKAYRFIKR